MKIGELIVKLGFINEDQLNATIREQQESRERSEYVEPIGNILLRKGLMSEEQLNQSLIEYFKYLSNAPDEPVYVRETAKVAMRAIDSHTGGTRLSEESKITLMKKIHEYEEKIAYDEKSIQALSGLEQKKVILDTIEKEKREIKQLIEKIDTLKKDLELLS